MDYIELNRITRNNDILKIWFCPVLNYYLSFAGETEENHKNLGQDHQTLNEKVLGKWLRTKVAMKHNNALHENSLTM